MPINARLPPSGSSRLSSARSRASSSKSSVASSEGHSSQESWHDAKTSHESEHDNFHREPPTAHGTLPQSAALVGRELAQMTRGAAHKPAPPPMSHAAPSSRAAGVDPQKKTSLLSRLGTSFRGMVQDKNKLFHACIFGGAVALMLALAISNPMLILVGLALLTTGVVGTVSRDPTKGPIAPPQVSAKNEAGDNTGDDDDVDVRSPTRASSSSRETDLSSVAEWVSNQNKLAGEGRPTEAQLAGLAADGHAKSADHATQAEPNADNAADARRYVSELLSPQAPNTTSTLASETSAPKKDA